MNQTLLDIRRSLLTTDDCWEEVYMRLRKSLEDIGLSFPNPKKVEMGRISVGTYAFYERFLGNAVLEAFGVDHFFASRKILSFGCFSDSGPHGKSCQRVEAYFLDEKGFVYSIPSLEAYENYEKINKFFDSVTYQKLKGFISSIFPMMIVE